MHKLIQLFTDDGNSVFGCSNCFHVVKSSDTYCWFCGNQITGGFIDNPDEMYNELVLQKEAEHGSTT